MRTGLLLAACAATLISGSAVAQSGTTLDSFVTRANRIPLNPTALLMPDTRRLQGEAQTAFTAVRREIAEARAAGRTPPACPPERISLNPREFLAFLNGIPQARRQRMSVTDGVRTWMASRYPCG